MQIVDALIHACVTEINNKTVLKTQNGKDIVDKIYIGMPYYHKWASAPATALRSFKFPAFPNVDTIRDHDS
jgi:hypothetical protein